MKKLFVSGYVGFDESATKAKSSMFLMRATTMGFYPERLTTYTSLLLSVGFLLCMILLP
jgi:hypothetical protein